MQKIKNKTKNHLVKTEVNLHQSHTLFQWTAFHRTTLNQLHKDTNNHMTIKITKPMQTNSRDNCSVEPVRRT